MSKALTLGNGNILINFDARARVRDFYYPYVGLENHVGGHNVHQIGVFTGGRLSWLADPAWQITVGTEADSFVGLTTALHEALGIKLFITDVVYNEKNILVRRITVHNLASRERTIKLFFHQQFEMYESHIAHTAYYDPEHQVLIHYRNRRVFLLNAALDGQPFNDYSTGVFSSEGKEGTHRDAEDGHLSQNPIEHGQADSVLGLSGDYPGDGERTAYYWVAVGASQRQVLELDAYVRQRGPGHLVETTRHFWQAWASRHQFHLLGLSEALTKLFRQSLFVVRAHVDQNGGIIASGDADTLQRGKDTYAYVWPRDAAYAALALTAAGDAPVARAFFNFCNEVISDQGYFLHKYSPDRSLGSSWHSWVRAGQPVLPIQEDETALVLWALWQYYELSKDLEFVELVYNSLIKKAADFMVLYRDEKTGLPKPSYDLWEEKFGVSTFTTSAVYGGLSAAARFAKLLGKVKSQAIYERAAEEVKTALLRELYDPHLGYFLKLINSDNGALKPDTTIDSSSIYGVYNFGVLPVTDERVATAMKKTLERLEWPGAVGGVGRYVADRYYQSTLNDRGNPWFVTTLWVAQYYLALAQSDQDLTKVRNYLTWALQHAQPSGLMSEQLDPQTGNQLSVAPLTWSHAELVLTITKYLTKLEQLGLCQACNPLT